MHPKSPIDPHRIRYLPPQFSWIDQRLVRDHWVELCDPEALALYLLLATVADAQGLSFYSEASLCERLSLPRERLRRARHWLVHLELIAFRAPVYQVLSLPVLPAVTAREVRSC